MIQLRAFLGVLLFSACSLTLAAERANGFVAVPSAVRVPEDLDWARDSGVGQLNILLELCQEDLKSTRVSWCDFSTPREEVLKLAREVRARGMGVAFFPMLLPTRGDWRGFIEPDDFAAWGMSYRERVLEIVGLAQEAGAREVIVGTELNRLFVATDPARQPERNAYWRALAAEARKLTALPTMIVANWDQYDLLPFWDASDFIALSAYYPLAESESSDTSVGSLVSHWKVWKKKLLTVAKREKKKLYFSEVGYASRTTAALRPWEYADPVVLDFGLQARLWEAFGKVWSGEAGLARFMVWGFEWPEDLERSTSFSPRGKPAEKWVLEALRGRR